jgi:hypothetical protein
MAQEIDEYAGSVLTAALDDLGWRSAAVDAGSRGRGAETMMAALH